MPYKRNVFILGAGFSAPARAPLMKNFIETARQLRRNPDDPLPTEQAEIFDQAFAYIDQLFHAQARVSLDVENIEAAFGLAEMDLAYGGVDPRANVRYALEALILQTLERSITLALREFRARVSGTFGQDWRMVHTHYGVVFAEGMRAALPETRAVYRIGPGMQRALILLARGPWPTRFTLAQAVASDQGGYWRDAYRSIERLEEMDLVESVPYGHVQLTEVGGRYVRRLFR